MNSSMERVLGIYELTERIIQHLDCPIEILRAQQVCRQWRDMIQTSPIIQKACWYRVDHRDICERRQPDGQIWKLNPAFNKIGISLRMGRKRPREHGQFDLKKRIYDIPGSWTNMSACQPPCRRMEIACYGDYSGDQTMYYLIECMTGYLRMGDVMAVLAECQNRQECGVDRWGGVEHYNGEFVPGTVYDEWDNGFYQYMLPLTPDDVSIKVVVEQAWGSGCFPAFSLRRIHPPAERDGYPASGKSFLHEMILHRMIDNAGDVYHWDRWSNIGSETLEPVCKIGEYKANLLAVKEHQEGYLAECSHIYRLLSDI